MEISHNIFSTFLGIIIMEGICGNLSQLPHRSKQQIHKYYISKNVLMAINSTPHEVLKSVCDILRIFIYFLLSLKEDFPMSDCQLQMKTHFGMP